MFLEKLDELMRQHNINKYQLSKESGIPYTTIVGFYDKGYDNVKLSTLNKLCEYFNVPLDYFIDKRSDAHELTEDQFLEKALLEGFRQLNADGKNKVLGYVRDLKNSGNYTVSPPSYKNA